MKNNTTLLYCFIASLLRTLIVPVFFLILAFFALNSRFQILDSSYVLAQENSWCTFENAAGVADPIDQVEQNDIDTLLQYWGNMPSSPPFSWSKWDLNFDMMINSFDYECVHRFFSGVPTVPAATNTPIPTATPIPGSCADTDGGQNYDVKGTIDNANCGDIGQSDYCASGGWQGTLNELYCDISTNSYCRLDSHICSGGYCCDGQCVSSACATNTPTPTATPIPGPCTDTDGGQNFDVKGTIDNANCGDIGQSDYCASGGSGGTLNELYCGDNNNYCRLISHTCDGSNSYCYDGRCIPVPSCEDCGYYSSTSLPNSPVCDPVCSAGTECALVSASPPCVINGTTINGCWMPGCIAAGDF